MTLPSDLPSLLASSRLALFVGADLPASLTGVPGRADLAQGLARRHGIDERLSLAAVAQRTMGAGSRFAFTDYLTQQLDTQGRQPQRFHQLVARLPLDIIITTAYDDLLERAFQQAGVAINRVVRDSDLAFRDPRRPTLIKLYGDVGQRDTLVVAEDDHYALRRSKETLLDEVQAVMRRSAVLFVGYNLADPDFNLLWREALDRMGRFALGAFAVSPAMPPAEREVWAARHVRAIDAKPLAVLEQLAGEAPTPQSASPPSIPPDDAAAPLALLATYRANLDHLLSQASTYGGESSAPLEIFNAIRAQREQIRQIKAALRTRGATVEDRFGDEEMIGR